MAALPVVSNVHVKELCRVLIAVKENVLVDMKDKACVAGIGKLTREL